MAYPWHPLDGQRVRVYGRQGRAERQILYIEVQPGLSREIPAWICDAATCAAITSGSAQIAIAGLIELRAVLDGHLAGELAAPSSTSSTAKEGLDERSVPQPIDARSRARRKGVCPPQPAPEELLNALADLLLEALGSQGNAIPTKREGCDAPQDHT